MLRASTLLLTTLFVLSPAENVLEKYEAECRSELGPDPCQRACEFEKMGLMSDGKFDIKRTMAMVDHSDLKLYPDDRKNLLKAAFHVCHREIVPDKSMDRCSAASAMYYCVNTLLQPEKLYKDEVPSNYPGWRLANSNTLWRLVPCRCEKFRGKFESNQLASYKTME